MLKSYSLSLFLILSFIFALPTFASHRASSTLTATLATRQDINVLSSFESTKIDMEGTLNTSTKSNFQLITNNKDGVIVTFEAISNSTSGEKSSMTGNEGTSTGKVILTNTEHSPSIQSINNALSSNAKSKENPNAIAYKISFKNKNGLNPVFNGGLASTSITGLSDFEIKIDNGAESNGTFGVNDVSGVYNTTIMCTLTTP